MTKGFLNNNYNEKVDIFKNTILNILTNFISHRFVLCDGKEPPWLNKKIRESTQEKKNDTYKNYRNNSSTIDLKCLK